MCECACGDTGKAPPEPEPEQEQVEGEWDTCQECGGTGEVVTCFDDICNGIGECIHGDGMGVCPECGGRGATGPWSREDEDAEHEAYGLALDEDAMRRAWAEQEV